MLEVVTLGETMLRFSPPMGESLESAPVLHVDPGGAESNLSIALARLGLRVGWVSRLPDNTMGRRTAAQIRQHGVDVSRVIWVPGERMGIYYIEPGRMPRPTNVIYDRAGSAFSRLEPDQVDWDYVGQAEWLHLTGITPALGDGPRRTVEQAIQVALARGLTISFDINYRAKLWSPDQAASALASFLGRVTLIMGAARDMALVFGTPAEGIAAARAMHDRFHPRLVVVTEGDVQSVAYDGNEYRSPTLATETMDPVGSGDAFAAGFIAGYRAGGVVQGLEWGNALAAIKRTYRGDFLWAGPQELQSVLDGLGRAIVR